MKYIDASGVPKLIISVIKTIFNSIRAHSPRPSGPSALAKITLITNDTTTMLALKISVVVTFFNKDKLVRRAKQLARVFLF